MSSESPVASTPILKSDLLTWKDPLKSAEVFGGILTGLLVFKTVNLFTIFFHLTYIGLIIAAGAEYAGKLIVGQGFVTKYKPADTTYARRFNENTLPAIGRGLQNAEKCAQKIVYAQDIESTLKAAGISYILYKVTSWFSLFTLITVAVILVFTVPAIYLKYRKEIDAAVAQYSELAKEKTSEFTKAAQDKAAPHLENLANKTGPVGAFIKKNLPKRTAGSTVGGPTSTDSTEEITSASTTGASKFPEVPTDSLNDSDIKEFVDEGRTKISSEF